MKDLNLTKTGDFQFIQYRKTSREQKRNFTKTKRKKSTHKSLLSCENKKQSALNFQLSAIPKAQIFCLFSRSLVLEQFWHQCKSYSRRLEACLLAAHHAYRRRL